MATLYLIEQGLKVQKKDERLVITKNNKLLNEIPMFQIERIMIFGNIQLTTQTISFLLDNDIPCSFFSLNGKFRGVLKSIESGNVFLRITQYERYLDKSFRLKFSKSIVEAKIKNEIKFLKKYLKNKNKEEIIKNINFLEDQINVLKDKKTLSSIMGIEGISTSIYFKTLSLIIDKKFNFKKRTHHPPKDQINSLLSFGYSILTSEIFSLLNGLGFDAYIGYFHDLSYLRPSLALDIIEEFRTPIIDSLVIYLINKKVIDINDFEIKDESYFLKEDAKKKFLFNYEKIMKKYRDIIKKQIIKLRETIIKDKIYEPFILE